MSQNTPIFILGAHKSGTSLLRNLLDGHNECFVIPFESHFFQGLGVPIDYYYRRQNRFLDNSKEAIIARFKEIISTQNSLNDLKADSIMYGKLNVDIFEQSFCTGLSSSNSPRDLFYLYIKAIIESLGEEEIILNNKCIIEKSVENAEFGVELHSIFPNAKFIHIIRNPYANSLALRKYKTSNKFPSVPEVIWTLKNSFHYLEKNQSFIPKSQYFVLKYEDLLDDTEFIMRQIADFLSIEFNQNLIIPTTEGKVWQGNSTSGVKFKGVSNVNKNRWKKEITALEVYYVNSLFEDYMEKYGYSGFEKKGFWKREKKEGFKTYLRNRLYKFYIDG
jgi:protein-tyrosine sulfotransferase